MTLGRQLRVRLRSAKADVRRHLNQLDNEEVRWARKVASLGRKDHLDVLHLGNSTVEWIDATADIDRRPLHVMLAEEMAEPKHYLALYGGSYDAELHDAYLQFALRVAEPKVVIVPLWYRGRFRPWREHPTFSRDEAAEIIASLPADAPWWRIRGRIPRPAQDAWAQYQAIPFETFAGLLRIGDYTKRLKDPDFARDDPVGRAKLFFAYHLSHRIEDDLPELAAVTRLGAHLKKSGIPIVAYENPIPIDGGVGHWGRDFREVAEANFADLHQAFRAGYGPVEILSTGMTIPADEFLDPRVADEHLKDRGRRRLRDAIVDGIAKVRPDLVRSDRVK